MRGSTLVLALATATMGLMAGLFYGFSVAVNPGFVRLPDGEYIAAMQAINEAIQNPAFVAVFVGAPVFLLLAVAMHARRPFTRRLGLLLAAAAIYLVGALGVTVAANIPLNNALAGVSAQASPTAQAAARAQFAGAWNRWHTVRTWASTAAFLLTIGACLSRGRVENQRLER